MTDIILPHYDTSPYAEKVRTGLGLKGVAWASVELPVIMPKPNLTALTGGYRKTPVLQIGADIYCDSQLIMRELERRYPTPSFYPAGHGAADALAWWAEKTTCLISCARISIGWIRRWLTGARSCKALPLASPISPPIIRFGSCDRISDRRRRRSTAFRGS